eukprot:TRINITY_DN919_c0_g1_i1.p1 TRINITY_DN919_c0_g1~~TRINITY_DN919_c0_g1_i1.p1  ORF type:complete len:815 (+),score=126.35 TRINITY_DN919_c0_g1_i1:22-2445(+)
MRVMLLISIICIMSLVRTGESAATPDAFTANATITFTKDILQRGHYNGIFTYVKTTNFVGRMLAIYNDGGWIFTDISLFQKASSSYPNDTNTLYRLYKDGCKASELKVGSGVMPPEDLSGTNTNNFVVSYTGSPPTEIVYKVPVANTTVTLTAHRDPLYTTLAQFVPSVCPTRLCSLKLDVMFILDHSLSMTTKVEKGKNGRTRFDMAVSFVTQMVSSFEVSEEKTHAGLTAFGHLAGVVANFTSDAQYFMNRLGTLKADGLRTCAACGMVIASEAMRDSPLRTGVPKVMILVTDGEPNNHCNVFPTSCTTSLYGCNISVTTQARDYAISSSVMGSSTVILGIASTIDFGTQVEAYMDSLTHDGGVPGLTVVYTPTELTPAVVADLKTKLSMSLCDQFGDLVYPICKLSTNEESYGLCCPDSTPNFCPICDSILGGDYCQPLQQCTEATKFGCAWQPKVCTNPDACTIAACNPANGECGGTPRDCEAENPSISHCLNLTCNPQNYFSPCETVPIDCGAQNTNSCLANWTCVDTGSSYTCEFGQDICGECTPTGDVPFCMEIDLENSNTTYPDCTFAYKNKTYTSSNKCLNITCDHATGIVSYIPFTGCSEFGKCAYCLPSSGQCALANETDVTGKDCGANNCYDAGCDERTGGCISSFKCGDTNDPYCSIGYCLNVTAGCEDPKTRYCTVPEVLGSCYLATCMPTKGGCYYYSDGHSLNSCGLCEPNDDNCPKVVPSSTIAAIAAGVVAAIIVAIVAFLVASSLATKKIYDALKTAKEAQTDAANENKLYENAATGGSNPAFSGNSA